LKPEFVKLDTSLIRNIHADPIKQKTILMLVELAGLLGIQLIAEQVEVSAEKEYLVQVGVRYAQGFLFAGPERLLE